MADILLDKITLKEFFETGEVPTQDNFASLITTLVAEGGNTGNISGAVQVGVGTIASATGAIAIGSNVFATNTSSIIFGSDAINDVPYSLKIGNIRIIGSGEPLAPQNGDLWVSDSHVFIRSNGISIQL